VVLSNGVGVTRASLRELQQRGIRLMISLDGFEADHDAQRVFANGRGSFRAVMRTIERALEVGLRPDISVTVSGQTAGGLATLMTWLLDRESAVQPELLPREPIAHPASASSSSTSSRSSRACWRRSM